MKKNSIFFPLVMLGLASFVLILGSCKDDDPAPEANFIFSADGLTITFDNLSKNADTYTWDFGDGSSDATESPSHVYAAEGTFTVKLTATGIGGTDTYTEDIVVNKPSIVIDSNFDEWGDHDSYYTGDAVTGSIKEIKVTSKNGFIYFYILADATTVGPTLQLFINGDNDGTTGWDYWGSYEAAGVDFLLEYVVEEFVGTDGATVLSSSGAYQATEADWPWTIVLAAADAVTETTGWVDKGSDKAIEFSVAKSLFPDLNSTISISFANSDTAWGVAGSAPIQWTDPLQPFKTIDL